MINTCNYSDDWQPYINDYDKFEYDIKLKDGSIVENCYPNGGKFNSISDLHDGMQFDENLVAEIRFSENPRYALNGSVSKHKQYEYIDKQMKKYKDNENVEYDESDGNYSNNGEYWSDDVIPSTYHVKQFIRDEKKIGRNDICPKCDSGLKYKKCKCSSL